MPSTVITGKVVGVKPLSVQIDQKIILSEEFLIIPQKLTDYEIELSFTEPPIIQKYFSRQEGTGNWGTRQELYFAEAVKHKIIIHNALRVGDTVILAVQDGGQSYAVLDRRAVNE